MICCRLLLLLKRLRMLVELHGGKESRTVEGPCRLALAARTAL